MSLYPPWVWAIFILLAAVCLGYIAAVLRRDGWGPGRRPAAETVPEQEQP